jgi:NADH:ubiquinone oxidoreductase subunit F (NADH-binding)/(2Fe-2S) ferredoxin
MKGDVEKNYKILLEKSKKEVEKLDKKFLVQVGSATCENAAGAKEVFDEVKNYVKDLSDVYLKKVGCTGRCSLEPIVSIKERGKQIVSYKKVDKKNVLEILNSHIKEGKILEKYLLSEACKLMDYKKTPSQKQLEKQEITHEFFEFYANMPFYCSQSRIALRNAGVVDPKSLYEYVLYKGFQPLCKILKEEDKNSVLKEVEDSKLRGRGGAGFPTAKKWKFAIDAKGDRKVIICNADEGDPGAFMDRSMLESDPYSIIEGMIIAGFTIGADTGFFYVRAEYPLAIKRIEYAIEKCKEHNLLGKNILGSNFDFDLEIRLGAGAFVCGEETALIHSIEGERGQPRIRPPFPAIHGVFGRPTVINNVETLANLPVVMSVGGGEFSKIGSEKSGGTKVFAVSGKVKFTGLVEVPMGTTLKEIVFDICGGIPNNKKLKAVQTGGPAGGCIPEHLMDTRIDYESLKSVLSMMGSGGLIVLDEDDCMVDVAKFFMGFCQNESCGKCTPCREGTLRMLEILESMVSFNATMKDLKMLERLAVLVQKASLCGLGRAAPNPIISTLKYFKNEYISHIKDKKCLSGKCASPTSFEIDPKKCVGCGACKRNCPVHCISGELKEKHVIDQNKCIKCGKCFEVCKFNAVKKF